MEIQWQVNLIRQMSTRKLMASEDKKTETSPAPRKEVPPENKSVSGANPSTTEGAQTPAASSSGYSRGEGQKPVSQAYMGVSASAAVMSAAVAAQCRLGSRVAAFSLRWPEERCQDFSSSDLQRWWFPLLGTKLPIQKATHRSRLGDKHTWPRHSGIDAFEIQASAEASEHSEGKLKPLDSGRVAPPISPNLNEICAYVRQITVVDENQAYKTHRRKGQYGVQNDRELESPRVRPSMRHANRAADTFSMGYRQRELLAHGDERRVGKTAKLIDLRARLTVRPVCRPAA
jgi:hypothetical protein